MSQLWNIHVALSTFLASQAWILSYFCKVAGGIDPVEVDIGCGKAGQCAERQKSGPHSEVLSEKGCKLLKVKSPVAI